MTGNLESDCRLRVRQHALALVLVIGCSKAPPAVRAPEVGFLRASPIVEYGPPSVEPGGDLVSAPLAEPTESPAIDSDGPASADDERAAEDAVTAHRPSAASTPTAVIAQANAMASQRPEADGFLNAVMTYTFLPGGIFQVFTAPNNVTDLVLEPGEELMGEPAAGDTLRWRLGVGTSAIAGVPQKHIFIKPTRAGLATNLTLNTNRRTYFLKLESVEGEFMIAVQWSYPQAQSLAPSGAPPSIVATPDPVRAPSPADVTALNFDYAIEVVDGRPGWKPQAVYDNGQKTFIRFDPSILHGESPALFVMERGEMQLVNYRVKQNLYVVDRLFELAELRLGQDDQDVVRLRNRRVYRPNESRPLRGTGRTPPPGRPGTPDSRSSEERGRR